MIHCACEIFLQSDYQGIIMRSVIVIKEATRVEENVQILRSLNFITIAKPLLDSVRFKADFVIALTMAVAFVMEINQANSINLSSSKSSNIIN